MSNVRPHEANSMTNNADLSDFPVSELVGQEATQLCVGLGQVQLHFYRPKEASPDQWELGARIDIEAGYELKSSEHETYRIEQPDFKTYAGNLTCLLGERITRVQPLPANEMLIAFTSGATVRLLTEVQGFESYHVHLAGNSITFTRHSAA